MKKLFCLLLISLPAFSQTTSTPSMTDRAAARFLDQATWGADARFHRGAQIDRDSRLAQIAVCGGAVQPSRSANPRCQWQFEHRS